MVRGRALESGIMCREGLKRRKNTDSYIHHSSTKIDNQYST